ncbi:MAG: DUF1801 domain-containing protein [Cyclobacteriaceae bacterium]|nr:DUF1801 domain-containing protein [Cyclobacteriaceae bacterium SS2]
MEIDQHLILIYQPNMEIQQYNIQQSPTDKAICEFLQEQIHSHLPEAESKIWHGHPVWFIEGNPIAGYSKEKAGIRLMFWSGADFNEDELKTGTGKFKDASIWYTSTDEIDLNALKRWLEKSRDIQWDYKNIVKRKGQLIRIK